LVTLSFLSSLTRFLLHVFLLFSPFLAAGKAPGSHAVELLQDSIAVHSGMKAWLRSECLDGDPINHLYQSACAPCSRCVVEALMLRRLWLF
jgi:hypothetical protein